MSVFKTEKLVAVEVNIHKTVKPVLGYILVMGVQEQMETVTFIP